MRSATVPTPFASSSPPVLPDSVAPTDAGPTDAGFGIYMHWPFCRSLCPYCDFNSHVADWIDQGRWQRALVGELDHFAADTSGRRVTSAFFGGGTPSLMAPETVAECLAAIRRHWRVAPELEVTLEANPTSVEAGRLAAFAEAGVNRISLGVQALDDDALSQLGRTHSRAEAVAAVELAARLFERYSFDLIYARPGQTLAAWRRELADALSLAGDHLSLYQLTIEPGTPFHAAQARGDLTLPGEDTAAALYEATQRVLEDAGLPAYEISNHARPGAACRHNLTYWRYGDYIGVGPGAHGRLTLDGRVTATRQHRAPAAWLRRVEADGHATRLRETLTGPVVREEMLLMGLRTADGIDRAGFAARTGLALEQALGVERRQALIDGGFLVLDADGLRATAAGRQRLNAVLATLLG